jgi:nucleoside-diphosphate-sugar epimerase
MKVLFIGGTGTISTPISTLVVEKGMELYVLNRGTNNDVLPKAANQIIGDIHNIEATKAQLKNLSFDVVVDWIAFTPEDLKRDYEIFKGKTKQFVFISSASAYHKPLPFLPITEAMELHNPFWGYSENKKRCEDYLMSINSEAFPVTIIRPSHTYNDKMIILQVKNSQKPYTMIHHLLKDGKMILPDDGNALWTITHNSDFAHGFVDILGNEKTYGEIYHLTGDKVYTWERIGEILFETLNKTPNFVYVPTKEIVEVFPELYGELYGDKKDSAVFDNSKIKEVAPNYRSEVEYSDVLPKAVEYYLTQPKVQEIDEVFLKKYNDLLEKFDK